MITPWSRTLLQVMVSQPVRKFPAFYETWQFFTVFASTRHLSPSWVRSVHSMVPIPLPIYASPFHFLSMRGSSKWSLSLRFPTKALYTLLLSPIHDTWPAHLILLELITRTIFAEECRSLNSSLFSYEKSILPSPEIKSRMSIV